MAAEGKSTKKRETGGEAAAAEEPIEGNIGAAESVYSKSQLKASKKYANRRDLLEILLEDGRQYSITAVEEKIEKFMKGKVK